MCLVGFFSEIGWARYRRVYVFHNALGLPVESNHRAFESKALICYSLGLEGEMPHLHRITYANPVTLPLGMSECLLSHISFRGLLSNDALWEVRLR